MTTAIQSFDNTHSNDRSQSTVEDHPDELPNSSIETDSADSSTSTMHRQYKTWKPNELPIYLDLTAFTDIPSAISELRDWVMNLQSNIHFDKLLNTLSELIDKNGKEFVLLIFFESWPYQRYVYNIQFGDKNTYPVYFKKQIFYIIF